MTSAPVLSLSFCLLRIAISTPIHPRIGKIPYVRWKRLAKPVSFLFVTAALGMALFAAASPQTHRARSSVKTPSSTKKTTSVAAASPSTGARDSTTVAPVSIEGIRANNLGVALMDQHNFPEATGRFQSACILVPDSDIGCVNAGIGFLVLEHYTDARKLLATATDRDPQNARAWFNLGLLDHIQNKNDDALEDFQKVAAIDPADASAECVIGELHLAAGRSAQALSAFQQALHNDPLSACAEAGLADTAGPVGSEAQKAHADRLLYLTSRGLSQPLGSGYGQQGKYSLADEMPSPDTAPPAIPIHFADVTQISGLTPALRGTARGGRRRPAQAAKLTATNGAIKTMADFLGSGACVFDYDGDGRPDIFLVDADGNGDAALYQNTGHGRFADVTKSAHMDFHGEGMGCAVGDYDNDGHADIALSYNGGVRLFHNDGKGTFSDVTEASGIRADGLVLGLTFVDFDRDGYLDLYITRFRDFALKNPHQPFPRPEDSPPGNMLWRNNSNGSFTDVTGTLAAAGDASSTGAIASDLTGNGAPDLLLTGARNDPELLANPRDGAFASASAWGAETQGPAAGSVVLDFDKDGRMDVALTHWQPTTLGLWRNDGGNAFTRVALPDPGWMRAWGIAALDCDHDGWIDLVAVGETFSGEGRIALLRNEGGKGFHDVTAQTGLDKIVLHDPRSIIAFDAVGDGSLVLLITQNHRSPVLLKSTGANKNNWADISLKGGPDNALGLGVRVEAFSGAQRQTWEIPSSSGYLSQSPPVIYAGFGKEDAADAARVHWGRSPLQAQIPVSGGTHITISQVDPSTSP